MDDFLLGGASAAGMILVIIQLAKMWGMSSKGAPVLAGILGIGFSILAELALTNPEIEWWIRVIIRGFQVSMTVVGIYATTKFAQEKTDDREAKKEAQEQQATIVTTETATPETLRKDVESIPEAGLRKEIAALPPDGTQGIEVHLIEGTSRGGKL